jgi:UDPglucose 6-dehydrogenase
MKLIVIGAGNIGLVTAVCFAEKGHTVYCVENDVSKLNLLAKGIPHFFEKDLETLLCAQIKNKTLQFRSSLQEVIDQADIIFLSVGTPNTSDGHVDLINLESVVSEIAKSSVSKNVVIRSTVPPSTQLALKKKNPKLKIADIQNE